MNQKTQPFWKDEPEIPTTIKPNLYVWFAKYIMVVSLLLGLAFPVLIFVFISPTLMFVWLAVVFLFFVYWFLRRKQKQKGIQDITKVQEFARETIDASHIGSAIHVAGHPLLQRKQPIVLALVDDQLNILGYETSTPLDTICLKDFQSIHTVVYDDERVPHIDVIDSAAQALQITFSWHEQSCTCLFRRMRKVRPIDWYHVIQQKRLQFSA